MEPVLYDSSEVPKGSEYTFADMKSGVLFDLQTSHSCLLLVPPHHPHGTCFLKGGKDCDHGGLGAVVVSKFTMSKKRAQAIAKRKGWAPSGYADDSSSDSSLSEERKLSFIKRASRLGIAINNDNAFMDTARRIRLTPPSDGTKDAWTATDPEYGDKLRCVCNILARFFAKKKIDKRPSTQKKDLGRFPVKKKIDKRLQQRSRHTTDIKHPTRNEIFAKKLKNAGISTDGWTHYVDGKTYWFENPTIANSPFKGLTNAKNAAFKAAGIEC